MTNYDIIIFSLSLLRQCTWVSYCYGHRTYRQLTNKIWGVLTDVTCFIVWFFFQHSILQNCLLVKPLFRTSFSNDFFSGTLTDIFYLLNVYRKKSQVANSWQPGIFLSVVQASLPMHPTSFAFENVHVSTLHICLFASQQCFDLKIGQLLYIMHGVLGVMLQ